MDGVAALVQVLLAAPEVTALVAPVDIMAGVLPQGTALPVLSVASVSAIDRHPVARTSSIFVRELVQITVMAATYEAQKAILRAAVKAANATFPVVDGIANVTIHTAGAGPDFMNDDASILIGTQDFRVTYNREQ